jgi:hypothetical protein
MKKPQGKTSVATTGKFATTSKTVKKTEPEPEEEPKLQLIVDSEDTYGEDQSIYYVQPKRLFSVKYLNDKIFDEVIIKNSNVEFLTSMNFLHILRKMKVSAPLTVIVSQPLSVMQSYDAKQIEANAKLAGFDKIEISDYTYTDEKKVKISTLTVTGVRPEKNPNQEIEIETTTTTTTKGKTVVTDKKITVRGK